MKIQSLINWLLHKRCIIANKQQDYEAIHGLIVVIESLDPYTSNHSRNVGNYALQLAQELDLPAHDVQMIHYGGLFHDLGKIGISPELLRKQTTLTPAEFEMIKEHPRKGARILEQFSFLKEIAPYALHHHEYMDGSGYPDGLKGPQIPLGSRIISLVDAYDALTTTRSYRQAHDRNHALDEIVRCTPHQFDPDLVEAFIRIADTL